MAVLHDRLIALGCYLRTIRTPYLAKPAWLARLEEKLRHLERRAAARAHRRFELAKRLRGL